MILYPVWLQQLIFFLINNQKHFLFLLDKNSFIIFVSLVG